MNSADMREVWKRLELKDGDVIFVDADAVDVSAFAGNINEMLAGSPLPQLDVLIIPVRVPNGKTVHDCVAHISRNEVSAMQGCKL